MQDGRRRQRRPLSPDDLRKRLPGDEGDFLVVPSSDRHYFERSLVPMVGVEFTRLSSGLMIPTNTAQPPQPIDLIGTYLTYEEVFGRRLGLGFVGDALRRVGRDPFVGSCADLLGTYEGMKADRRAIDDALVTASFQEPTASRVRGLLHGNRTVVSPQTLLLLMQFSLALSPDEPPEGSEPSPFIAVVLALQDDLGHTRDEHDQGTSQVFRGETTSGLFREVVSSQNFLSPTGEGTVLARHHLHWFQLPAEAGDRPGRVDLPELFREATGVSKVDFATVGTVLWVNAEIHHNYPVPATIFDSVLLSREQIEAALAHFAATPEQLRDEIGRLQERFQTQWSFHVLSRYPVMRMADGGLLVLSKRLLLERIFGWLPIFDLVTGLKEQGRTKDASRAKAWYEAMCEEDALMGLANLAPATGLGQRLYGEKDIQGAFGKTLKNADVAIEYPDAWVVMEISTRHLMSETVIVGDPQALEKDLRLGIDEKVKQIDSTIGQLIADESRLTGLPSVPRRRYVALLVITEGFPVNPMTMTAIHERLSAAGLLTDPRIGPLHVVDQEELNMIEAVSEAGGPSLLALIEEHERASLRNAAFRDWLIVERGRGVGPDIAKRTEAPQAAAWEPVIARIRDAEAASSQAAE